MTSLLEVYWVKHLSNTISKIKLAKDDHQSENVYKFNINNFFGTKHGTKKTKVKSKKLGCKPIQQKAPPIPFHLLGNVEKDFDRLLKSGHLKRLETVEADCFVTPFTTKVQKDKPAKNAKDARNLNENCIKKRPHMPKMKELLNHILTEVSKYDIDALWSSTVDLNYAKLSP